MLSQDDCLQWLVQAHVAAESARGGAERDLPAFAEKTRKLLARFGMASEIGFRGCEPDDFSHLDRGRMRLFHFRQGPRGPGTGERMTAFREAAERAFDAFYPEGSRPPDGILHVTCTGYASPSAAQRLVEKRGWNRSTPVTHAYHMGCAAAFPAIRIAAGFGHRTDIVHTEVCSLHLNAATQDLEQLVVQTLFADGFIRYTMMPAEDLAPGLEILRLREEIAPRSAEAMTWNIGDWGMEMGLSRDVPQLIERELRGYLDRLFAEAGVDFSENRLKTVFAVHPGGPRILDRVQDLLELKDEQLRWSREVLYRHGNMSSATLPHVWQRIVEEDSIPPGRLVASVAFAPGLTISGGLFRKNG